MAETITTKDLTMFAGIVKRDEAKREVTGVLAEESVDKAGEIFDYATSKAEFQKWNEQFQKATAGLSVGNVREMHQKSAVGRFTSMEYDDAAKQILVTAKVVDDAAWKKVQEGVYTGFSIGGRYLKSWDEGDYKRYTAAPSEGSLVDNPCMYGAQFTAVKADGSTEVLKFAAPANKAAKTKLVAGEDLPPSAFAYVGDPEKTETWKLPIKFSDEEKTKSHIRNALARFDQTKGIPASEKSKVKAKIEAAAKKHGIDTSEKLAKNLADVADLAALVQQLNYIRNWAEMEAAIEEDGSSVPGKLKALVDELSAVLVEMAQEETSELTADDDDAVMVIAMAAIADGLKKIAGLPAFGKHAEAIEAATKLLGAAGGADHTTKETDMDKPELHKIAEHETALAKINTDLAAVKSGFEKFQADVTDAITNLADAVKKLAGQEVKPKAAKMDGVAVDKAKDGVQPVAAEKGEKPTTRDLIKRVHAGGGSR